MLLLPSLLSSRRTCVAAAVGLGALTGACGSDESSNPSQDAGRDAASGGSTGGDDASQSATGGASGSGGSGGGAGGASGSGGTSGAGGSDGGLAEDAGDTDAGDAAPAVLDEVVVTVVGGNPLGNEIRLLDGSGRSAMADAEGKATFSDVPVPYGVAVQVFSQESPTPTMEARGLTRPDPTFLGTLFTNIGNALLTGRAVPSVPGGGSLPGGCDPYVIVGNTEVGQLLATDLDGSFTNRGLVWPGKEPFSTRLFGLYFCSGTTPPEFVSFGLSNELTLSDGDNLTGIVFDVDSDVPERDHDFVVDYDDWPQATEATVEIWSATIGGRRLPFAGNFRSAVLARLAGHSGAPVTVPSAVPTGATSVIVAFGNASGPDESAWVVKPVEAGDSTTFAVTEAPRIAGVTPASHPTDLETTAPVVRWDPIPGADLIEVSVYQTGTSMNRHVALVPGDATELDLGEHYALSTPPTALDTLTVTIQVFDLDGVTVDDVHDGSGRSLSPGGQGFLPLLDRLAFGRRVIEWAP